MLSAPPFPNGPERRRLAAIVFTDVAGFSARMQVEEAAALRLLERDFAIMRELSKQHSGTVLKSMGDGLLIYFTSAVHAVAWSLQAQRHFADQARQLRESDVLKHRVGLHVGDVFVRADDVMGDGVNIASRVQAEAPPGGICISQTVYDLVKNKMQLSVHRLEPRRLKNIRENVPMYHVLLEEPPKPPTSVPFKATPPVPLPASPARALTRPKPRPGLALLLLIGVAGASVFLVRKHFDHERQLRDDEAKKTAFIQATQRASSAEAVLVPLSESMVPPSSRPDSNTLDFLKLLAENPNSLSDERITREAAEAIASLDEWRKTELAKYTAERPLRVRALRSGTSEGLAFQDGTRITFAGVGVTRSRDWQIIPAVTQAGIIAALLDNSPLPPPAVVRGAEAFALMHGISELGEILQRRRTRR